MVLPPWWTWTEACGQDKPPVERRLFEDGFFYTQDQRAKFFFDTLRPLAEPTDAEVSGPEFLSEEHCALRHEFQRRHLGGWPVTSHGS